MKEKYLSDHNITEIIEVANVVQLEKACGMNTETTLNVTSLLEHGGVIKIVTSDNTIYLRMEEQELYFS